MTRHLERRDVTIDVIPMQCPEDYRDQDYDPEVVQGFARAAEESPCWGWCDVKLVVNWQGLEGTAYLHMCSYKDEDDFKRCDYYSSMLKEALDALNENVARLVARAELVRDLLNSDPHYYTGVWARETLREESMDYIQRDFTAYRDTYGYEWKQGTVQGFSKDGRARLSFPNALRTVLADVNTGKLPNDWYIHTSDLERLRALRDYGKVLLVYGDFDIEYQGKQVNGLIVRFPYDEHSVTRMRAAITGWLRKTLGKTKVTWYWEGPSALARQGMVAVEDLWSATVFPRLQYVAGELVQPEESLR